MKNDTLATKKSQNEYETKAQKGMFGLINRRGLSLRLSTRGTLGGKMAISFLFDSASSREEIAGLVEDAKKCFRKYEPIVGSGAHHKYAKEIIFPTVYLVAKEENK